MPSPAWSRAELAEAQALGFATGFMAGPMGVTIEIAPVAGGMAIGQAHDHGFGAHEAVGRVEPATPGRGLSLGVPDSCARSWH